MHACRGFFDVNATRDSYGNLPDTYINVGKGGWAKGVAFINGFNLVRPFLLHHTALGTPQSAWHGMA